MTYLYTEIRPSSPNGLILFNRQNDGPDYIAIVLRNGLVEFYYNLGGGATVIISNINLTLGEWHSIEASRSGQSGTLIVNNQVPITGVSTGDFHSLQLSGDLLIGGALETVTLPDELGTVQHFHGCLRELRTQAMASGGQSAGTRTSLQIT
ncbi:MAG: laminin G domain-containing protein [Proteobacteria bacterium]|nr:laminin G domain-containing protein [Pseudomonadota bacterium]